MLIDNHNYIKKDKAVIPDSVTSIDNGAFAGCTSLKSIEIPDSVTSIGDLAFVDCSGLISIEIPGSVKNIGIFAFSECKSLMSIKIKSKRPAECALQELCLTGAPIPRITLFVPIGTGYCYRHHPFFGRFKGIVPQC